MIETDIRALKDMHIIEKMLLFVTVVIGCLGLIYVVIIVQSLGLSTAESSGVFSSLTEVLILQGIVVNAVLIWRVVEGLKEIKIVLETKKK